MRPVSVQTLFTVDHEAQARRSQAETKLKIVDQVRADHFSQLAYDMLGDLVFSIQYVHDPSSTTGVCLQVYFKPETNLQPLRIDVKSAWIAWQISPR